MVHKLKCGTKCGTCGTWLRWRILIRELYNLDESEMREEIKQRKRQKDDRGKREQLVVEIAQQEGLPLE